MPSGPRGPQSIGGLRYVQSSIGSARSSAAGIPWVDVGYHGPLTVTATYVPGQGPCWQCQRMAIHEESILDGEPERGADALVLGNAVMAPSAGIAGYFAANAVMGVLTGGQHVVPGRQYAVNLVTPDAPFAHDARPRADCPDCGKSGRPVDPAANRGGSRPRPGTGVSEKGKEVATS